MSAGRRRLTLTKRAQKGIQALPTTSGKQERPAGAGGGWRPGKEAEGGSGRVPVIRLGRTHRLVYIETTEEIQVINVGPRGDVYKG